MRKTILIIALAVAGMATASNLAAHRNSLPRRPHNPPRAQSRASAG